MTPPQQADACDQRHSHNDGERNGINNPVCNRCVCSDWRWRWRWRGLYHRRFYPFVYTGQNVKPAKISYSTFFLVRTARHVTGLRCSCDGVIPRNESTRHHRIQPQIKCALYCL